MKRTKQERVALARVTLALTFIGAFAALTVSVAASAQPADEHAAASAIVAQLSADAAQSAARQAVTADALLEARNALERATRLRVAGDEAHAKAADGLALEWAETARDVVRAADAEASAAELRHKALDAQAQLDRSRALVEEAVASIGRLQAELDQASAHAGQTQARTAVEVHEGDPPSKANAGKAGKSGGKKGAPKKDAGGTP
jgi:hypothetical protein